MTRQLFVGFDFTAEVRRRIATIAAQLAVAGLSGRFEPAEKLHCTLAFLGPVETPRIPELIDVLNETAGELPAFRLRLNVIGAFPSPARPRVVWLGSGSRNLHFEAAARAVRNAFANEGFIFEQPAVAHVTLCRIKRGPRFLPNLGHIRPVTVNLDSVVLFESAAVDGATVYQPLFRVPFTPPQRTPHTRPGRR